MNPRHPPSHANHLPHLPRQPLRTISNNQNYHQRNFVENHPSLRRGNSQKIYAYRRESANSEEEYINQAKRRIRNQQEEHYSSSQIDRLKEERDRALSQLENEKKMRDENYVPQHIYDKMVLSQENERNEKKQIQKTLKEEKAEKEKYQRLYANLLEEYTKYKESKIKENSSYSRNHEKEISRLRKQVQALERQLSIKGERSFKKCSERLIKCAAGFMETSQRIVEEEIFENGLMNKERFDEIVKCGRKTFDLGSDRRALVCDLVGYAEGNLKSNFRVFDDTGKNELVINRDDLGNDYIVNGKREFVYARKEEEK